MRKEISDVAGRPMIVTRRDVPGVRSLLASPSAALRGPLTPDHVIRTKRLPLVGRDVAGYAASYAAYFAAHADRRGVPLTMLDPAPRIVLDEEFGMLAVGPRASDAEIAAEIYAHTVEVILTASSAGAYEALPAEDVFDVEYWELEQAKLGRAAPSGPFVGEVALVTGAASGIGKACVAALRAAGAAVIGVDLAPCDLDGPDALGVVADVCDGAAVAEAVRAGVERFGGVDMVVASAGVFPPAVPLASFSPDAWDRALSVNARAVATLFEAVFPMLSLAPRGGRAVVIGSKNAPAPGPGAVAYSASKAAVTQIARVAALEWADAGIRVNVVHPDAVFDTGLWTDDLLRDRASRYGLTVEEYKRRNLLGVEVSSARVAATVVALCSDAFGATTGAQVPVDGGNERVI